MSEKSKCQECGFRNTRAYIELGPATLALCLTCTRELQALWREKRASYAPR